MPPRLLTALYKTMGFIGLFACFGGITFAVVSVAFLLILAPFVSDEVERSLAEPIPRALSIAAIGAGLLGGAAIAQASRRIAEDINPPATETFPSPAPSSNEVSTETPAFDLGINLLPPARSLPTLCQKCHYLNRDPFTTAYLPCAVHGKDLPYEEKDCRDFQLYHPSPDALGPDDETV